MKILMLITLSLYCVRVQSQVTKTFTGSDYKVIYTQNEGRISGNYKSFYTNGNKRAQGQYLNNYRIGKWTVWDENGTKKVERNYASPLEYKKDFPEPSTEEVVTLMSEPIYKLEYNDKNYIENFFVEERAVYWSKRVWRIIEPGNNSELFKDDFLFEKLYHLIEDSSITAYNGKTDQFKTQLETPLAKIEDVKVLHYKIKEDWFFDIDRFVMESRIIGICPVVVLNSDTLDLFWVYFPEARAHFAKSTISFINQPNHVKSLDDFFFFRCFSSLIIKESNVFDRQIDPNKLDSESERIEINIIEKEHDLWLGFY